MTLVESRPVSWPRFVANSAAMTLPLASGHPSAQFSFVHIPGNLTNRANRCWQLSMCRDRRRELSPRNCRWICYRAAPMRCAMSCAAAQLSPRAENRRWGWDSLADGMSHFVALSCGCWTFGRCWKWRVWCNHEIQELKLFDKYSSPVWKE